MQKFFNNAIFWVEVDRIKPNPFQPRKEFDQDKLNDLARSIRQYGVIQPLTVTRREVTKEDGGIATEYELIAGERRLRASKIAGVAQVPVLIRDSFDDDKTKLELAIIENLQREDLNPVDRALAFEKLVKDFGFKQTEVAEKVGKSREYVSNTIRLLGLPQEMQLALSEGKITEGHTRPLLMLTDRPQEQMVLFKEIMLKRLTVRDTESIARRIASDRVRKKEYLYSPEVLEMERELGQALGTRVAIEVKENGGKLTIDFTNEDDLRVIFGQLAHKQEPELAIQNGLASPVGETKSKLQDEEIRGPFGEQVPADASEDAPTKPSDSGYADFPAGKSAEVLVSSHSQPPTSDGLPSLDDRSLEEKTLDENTFSPESFSL